MGVERMNLKDRKCLFPNEQKLQIFNVYTYEGCLIECRLKHIIKVCKCVPYFFIGLQGKNK
ncbi:hypothetical protein C0J52_00511 [Blattella germanica]|nr:hypothetical protein C0J52_00511 [Blattella germanica]